MNVRQMAHIALMGAILYAVFQAFSNTLYLEMITFTILCFAHAFTRKEVVISCIDMIPLKWTHEINKRVSMEVGFFYGKKAKIIC
ncbi:hypothetical protein [uncultured Faecalicoccus sp.]|uniref:hypothetical protein n=1 Tax=uncultured Faecalicoccus sp. TaxID=1971760 RepID=UPI0025FBE2E5|nr:hypothetical protein [uncultured Faecalicoccus sp.]